MWKWFEFFELICWRFVNQLINSMNFHEMHNECWCYRIGIRLTWKFLGIGIKMALFSAKYVQKHRQQFRSNNNNNNAYEMRSDLYEFSNRISFICLLLVHLMI